MSSDQKISELTEKTTPVADDLLVLVDSAASPIETKKIKVSNLVSTTIYVAHSLATAANDMLMAYCMGYKHSFKEKDVRKNTMDEETYEHLKRFYDGWLGDLDL